MVLSKRTVNYELDSGHGDHEKCWSSSRSDININNAQYVS